MKIEKSFYNTNRRFPTGNIITYYSGNNLCYRIVEKENTFYWTQGSSFDKVEEVKDAIGLFIVEHPMGDTGIVGYFKSVKDAVFYAKKTIPKTVYGRAVVWKTELSFKEGQPI